jgi:hypothetical protein
MMKRFFSVLALFFVVAVAGCSPTRYVYKEIASDKDTYNVRTFDVTAPDLQKAVMEMLLSKKFVIDHEDAATGLITAKRFFSKSYQTVAVVVQSKIVTKAEKSQELYLNGVQTTERNYVADRTRFFLWIVPLPGGGGKEVTKSKESEIIIDDKSFYEDLFTAVQKALPAGQ